MINQESTLNGLCGTLEVCIGEGKQWELRTTPGRFPEATDGRKVASLSQFRACCAPYPPEYSPRDLHSGSCFRKTGLSLQPSQPLHMKSIQQTRVDEEFTSVSASRTSSVPVLLTIHGDVRTVSSTRTIHCQSHKNC